MTEEVTQAQEEQVQLSLQDIATCVQVIDICSKRGGFEGQEMEAVGGLRNRIVKFLEANKPAEGEAPVTGAVPEVEVEAEVEAEA